MKTILHKLLGFLFPERCIFCHKVLRHGEVCDGCRDKLKLCHELLTCKKCSSPIYNGILCGNCLVVKHYFKMCFAATVYEKQMRSSLLWYKFYGHAEYGRAYARLIDKHMRTYEILPQFDAVIPVPLSKLRFKERGFNQSALIAKELARLLGLPYSEAIQKIRHTPAQSSLHYRRRLSNLRRAFRVPRPETVRGKTLLLVDDIMTTGATADEVSKTLLAAGAKEVYVAVVAVTRIDKTGE